VALADGTVELDRLLRELAPLGGGPVERTEGAVRRRGQKTNECFENESNAPGRLPEFRVKSGETQTDLGVGLEATAFGQENNVRWFEGVFRRQQDATVVNSASEIGLVSAANGKVPGNQ